MQRLLSRSLLPGVLAVALAACGSVAATPEGVTPPAGSSQEGTVTTRPPDPSPDLPTAPPAAEATPAGQPTRAAPTLQPAPVARATAAPAGGVEPGLDRYIQQGKADLAARLGIAADSIEVIEARAVIWPDRGAGCPQPGMAFQQVPTEGLFIGLRAGGVAYNYHSREGRDPFYCPQSAGPPGPPSNSGGEP